MTKKLLRQTDVKQDADDDKISDKAKLTTSHYERRSFGRNKRKTNYMARWILTKYNTCNVDNSNSHKPLAILSYAERILLAISK